MSLPIPKPPGPNGNPPPYDPKGDLAERCAKAEAELAHEKQCADSYHKKWQRAEAELERVTADRDNETKWAKQYHDDWVKVRDELECVQKQAAAMREALEANLKGWNERECRCDPDLRGTQCYKHRCLALSTAALQPDAGADYIRREDVRPLADALRQIGTDDRYPHPVVLKAIEHAKSLGL